MKQFFIYLLKKDIFMRSAQVAYYFLLSLFPFIYIITRILSVFSLSVVNFLDSLKYVFPGITFDVIYDNFLTITLNPSSASTVLYSFIALWASSMLFNSLKVTFAESYPKGNTKSRLFIRIISIIITIAVLLVIVFSFFAVLILNIGLSFISRYIDVTYLSHTITVFATIIIIIVDMVLLYMILPPKRITFSEAVPGAIFATAGLSLSSMFFSYYVSQIADYSKLYGTMGSVIVLLLWLYICSIVIIGGGHINAYFINLKNRT
ncbi:MAG: YihY/virulence factor BrkB family protein [Clostridia bacterium]|nr:YihY/virulence factor BrkB family protein [Clostridia bacterium]